MKMKPTVDPDGSPVPGVIPGPPEPSAATEPASPRPRDPMSVLLATLLSAVRGRKHRADAEPPAGLQAKER